MHKFKLAVEMYSIMGKKFQINLATLVVTNHEFWLRRNNNINKGCKQFVIRIVQREKFGTTIVWTDKNFNFYYWSKACCFPLPFKFPIFFPKLQYLAGQTVLPCQTCFEDMSMSIDENMSID